jgi:RimJ/RimL family protein N-acetyltransferase
MKNIDVQPIALQLNHVVHTERLTVRCPAPGDGKAVFEATMDSLDELREFPASLPWAIQTPSIEASEAFCRNGVENFAARRDFPFLFVLQETGTVVGCGGIHRPQWSSATFDIGWWGRTPYLGRGLITEAVQALLQFAFSDLRARRVQAIVDEMNGKSRRLCERVGLTLEHTQRDCGTDVDAGSRNLQIYALME